MRASGVVAILVSRVLHLHHLPLGSDVAVAAGHQHGLRVRVANLLSGASVIVGKTVENYEIKTENFSVKLYLKL